MCMCVRARVFVCTSTFLGSLINCVSHASWNTQKHFMWQMGFSRRIVSLFQAVYRNSNLQNNNSGIMHWFSVFALKTGIVIKNYYLEQEFCRDHEIHHSLHGCVSYLPVEFPGWAVIPEHDVFTSIGQQQTWQTRHPIM